MFVFVFVGFLSPERHFPTEQPLTLPAAPLMSFRAKVTPSEVSRPHNPQKARARILRIIVTNQIRDQEFLPTCETKV